MAWSLFLALRVVISSPAFLFLTCLLFCGPAYASVSIDTRSMQLEFSDFGDLLSLQACLPGCDEPEAQTQRFSSYRGFVSVNRDSDGLFTFERTDGDHSIRIEFNNLVSGESRRWRIPHQGYLLGLELSRPQAVSLTSGDDFLPRQASGFSAWLEKLRYVQIRAGSVRQSDFDETITIEPVEQRWTGFRNRFWTAMVKPDQRVYIRPHNGVQQAEAQLDLHSELPGPLRFTVYAGPLELRALQSANKELGSLMYAGIWDWFKWLTRALRSALSFFDSLVHHVGVSIIVLALLIWAALWPLIRRAELIRAATIRSKARPGLKILIAPVILVSVAVCTFIMLSTDIWLYGASFLWISDLSMPDAALKLSFNSAVPGAQLNLLPLILFALMLLTASRNNGVMPPGTSRLTSSRRVWGMPLLVLLVFYTIPAGMVLFWVVISAMTLASALIQGRQAPA